MDMDTAMGCLVLLVSIGYMPFGYVLNGWVLSILWRWYIAPLGLPAITIPSAIGVSLVVGFLTVRGSSKDHTDDRSSEDKLRDCFTNLAAAIVHPLLVLLIGWIVWQFI